MAGIEMNQLTDLVISKCIQIHREVGPGLLESVYEVILFHELVAEGLIVQRQIPVPITYRGLKFDEGYRIDLLVEHSLILEIKAVEKLAPVAKSQLLTYLKLRNCTVGLILNFGQDTMKAGIHRVVNGFIEPTSPSYEEEPPSLY